MGNGFFILMRKHIVTCLGVVDLFLSFSRNTVTFHLVQQVFCIVRPIKCNIATSQFCFGYRRDIGLRAIQTKDIVVCSRSLEKLALLELGITHHEPSVIHIRVELLASKELFLLLGTLLIT